jgi:hypothetical protein
MKLFFVKNTPVHVYSICLLKCSVAFCVAKIIPRVKVYAGNFLNDCPGNFTTCKLYGLEPSNIFIFFGARQLGTNRARVIVKNNNSNYNNVWVSENSHCTKMWHRKVKNIAT